MREYECHWTSNNAYPFCFGAKHPQEFVKNDCQTCPWYSEYWRERKMKELMKIKELKSVLEQPIFCRYSLFL